MKKSLILIILVSLVVLMSACTINYPKLPDQTPQGCCVVKDISTGNTLGCYFMLHGTGDVDCNKNFGSYGNTQYSSTSCDIPDCYDAATSPGCMGISPTGLPYLVNDQTFGCDDNKLSASIFCR